MSPVRPVPPPHTEPGVKWLPAVIHPQTAGVCWQYSPRHFFSPWPADFPHGTDMVLWPVPRLKDARLVDCYCGKTGIQPATPAALVRYVPGAELAEDQQTVTLSVVLPSLPYPTGSGEDEVDRDPG